MAKLISLIILVLCTGGLFAQELIVEQGIEDTQFWLLVPYNILGFRANSDVSDYQVTVQIKNSRRRVAFTHNSSIRILKRDWLADTAIPVRFESDLEPGNYSASIRIRNRRMGSSIELQRQFKIGTQAIEHGMPYIVATRDSISFIPPNLSRIDDQINSLRLEQRFAVEVDSIGVFADSTSAVITNPSSPLSIELLPLINQGSTNTLKLTFYEANIQFRMDAFLYSPWFAYRQRYTLRKQRDQIRYIATQNEWLVLRRLRNDDLEEGLEQFWTIHDPSPGTLRNEARELFYQRVLTADERYTIHARMQGWASDRGRIYIKYGEPDEIVSEVLPLDTYPYIVWHYYNRNLRFIFDDVGGFGQYTLRNTEDEY